MVDTLLAGTIWGGLGGACKMALWRRTTRRAPPFTAAVLSFFVCSCASKPPEPRLEPYIIVQHHVVPATQADAQRDEYTVRHGKVVFEVRYRESQSSTAKTGDPPGSGLHWHSVYASYPSEPDLSQIPATGVAIRQCALSKIPTHDGSPSIAIQSTPEPCMIQMGDTLRYEIAPNGPVLFTYVNFDVVSEKLAQ
jgi:hypothetical protein